MVDAPDRPWTLADAADAINDALTFIVDLQKRVAAAEKRLLIVEARQDFENRLSTLEANVANGNRRSMST